MTATLIEDRDRAGSFRVENIGEAGDIEIALFMGPDARERAIHFAGTYYDQWSDPENHSDPRRDAPPQPEGATAMPLQSDHNPTMTAEPAAGEPTEAEIEATPPSALGNFACPICGYDQPHNHETADVNHWLNAQAGRFGYTCRIIRQDEDAFIDRVLASLDTAQREWQQAHGYPKTSIDEYKEAIEILQSRAAPPSGWRPIAEAPKDGTLILGYDCRVGWNYFVIRWIDGEWYTMDSDLNPFIGLPPTHFMPLPSPPTTDAQETKDE